MIPVYLINGFLESGKTEFIKYTISQPYFQTRGTTLLILCEEGELEYEEALLKKTRTVMEVIEDEEDFTIEQLMELEKKHKPERIIIEFNGTSVLSGCKNTHSCSEKQKQIGKSFTNPSVTNYSHACVLWGTSRA